jgi:predicted amidohydrolase YtcJ
MSDIAETIILNGRVKTFDPAQPTAEAVAVGGGRILKVGSRQEVESLRGPETRIIDAAGGSVLPGFSENHMHIFSGSAELDHLQLAGISGMEALKEKIAAFSAEKPDEMVLYAQGADYTLLGTGVAITRHHLDEMSPERPLVIFAHDHHTAWANTRALEMSGLLHGGEVPPGNEIVMAADGLASGELREMEAFNPLLTISGFDRFRQGLATGLEPDPYPDEATFRYDMDVMRRGLDYCARHGITTILNMDGNRYQLELLDAVLKEDGSLPCRIKVPFHYKPFMALDMLERASEMTERFNNDYISCGLVKFFYDGVIDSGTAVMVEPFADDGGNGEPLFTEEHFREAVIEADRRGLQIAVHAIGDGAVRAVLDAYEAARKANGPRDSRHRIEHIEVVHPDDIKRFAELGVIASMQPPHPPGAMGLPMEPTVSKIGRDRWRYSYAWRTLKDAGAHIPFASDWPVSPICAIRGIEAAVNRKPWGPEDVDHHFTLDEAIAGYTVEGAYAEFAEDRKGRIKPGYMADLVILSGDIEAVSPEEIHTLAARATLIGGSIGFSDVPDWKKQ